ncbi:MAG: hypothetical protein J6Z40_11630 [Oscillospiraceae bacterium]|nr:hypothetical protein [Oscillospiraceae bacterium]
MATTEYGNMSHTFQEIDALPEALAAEAAARSKTDAALAELIDSGAKNKVHITRSTLTETKRGITATFDPVAGTVELDGDHDGTGGAIFELYSGNAADQPKLPPGTYHLSGCPAGGSTTTYRISLASSINATDTGDGVDFTIDTAAALAPRILISEPSGASVSFNHTVCKIMVCLKSAWDISNKFVPYCPDLQELWGMIQS